MRTGFARNTDAPLRLAAIRLEFVPTERPIHGQPVEGSQPKVLGREAIGVSLPMHGGPADSHSAGDYSGSTLVLNEISRPRVLAVKKRTLAIPHSVLGVEQPPAGFDNRDVQTRVEAQ